MNHAPSLLRQSLYHMLLILSCLAVLYPILWVVKMALTPSQAFFARSMAHPGTQISFENFIGVISTKASDGSWLFGRQLLNLTIIAAITSTIGVAFSCTAGYAMSRFAFPGRDAGMSLFLITQMFPGVVMAIIPLHLDGRTWPPQLRLRPFAGLCVHCGPLLHLEPQRVLRHHPQGTRGCCRHGWGITMVHLHPNRPSPIKTRHLGHRPLFLS